MNLINLTNKRFSRLTVIERDNNKKGRAYWICICDCGNIKSILGQSLRNGKIMSCGCLNREKSRQRMTKHNLRKCKLYNVWTGIKQRCYNKNQSQYKYYGGKGIIMCNEWKNDFMSFYDWAISNGYDKNAQKGECTIDRIDVNGNYEPNNCRWVNSEIQSNNKTSNYYITYNNETLTLAQWSKKLGINYWTLKRRIKEYGWTIERAFKEKPFIGKNQTYLKNKKEE